MTKYILIILFLYPFLGIAQQIERIEVTGRVIVETDEKEGITVYNTSSNKGTTTDENGSFKIKVGLNDVIAFGALQFKDFTVTIDDRIIDSKQLTVFLVEDVNKLDEVLVLPYDLSGNLKADLNSVRTYNIDIDTIYAGIQDFDDYEFSADNKTAVNNPSVDDQLPYMDNGLNIINLVGLFFKQPNDNRAEDKSKTITEAQLLKRYNPEYLKSNFKIPTDKAEAFLAFIEGKKIDIRLLKKEREIELLEYLLQESRIFLNSESGKN